MKLSQTTTKNMTSYCRRLLCSSSVASSLRRRHGRVPLGRRCVTISTCCYAPPSDHHYRADRNSYSKRQQRAGNCHYFSATARPATTTSTTTPTTATTIGLLRETYDPWERRTPITPSQVADLLSDRYVDQVIVQPCPKRIYPDHDYEIAGAILSEDLAAADVCVGVKRPQQATDLLPNKTYLFFSHTIKGQPGNMDILRTCRQHQIQLFDYEKIMCPSDERKRLVAFGRYAGLAGALDTFAALGQRMLLVRGQATPFLHCNMTYQYDSLDQALHRVDAVATELVQQQTKQDFAEEKPFVIAVTGKGGTVHEGCMEILGRLPHEIVSVVDLPKLMETPPNNGNKLYIVPIDLPEIYSRIDDPTSTTTTTTPSFDREDFFHNPETYRCSFTRDVLPYCDAIINCTYWDPRFPRLITKHAMKRYWQQQQQQQDTTVGNKNRLLHVTDISCDVNGSIEFLERTTCISQPYYTYDPLRQHEIVSNKLTVAAKKQGVSVMGVDILPTQLPKESSDYFADKLMPVIQTMIRTRHDQQQKKQQDSNRGVDISALPSYLANACITNVDGQLTPSYRYLDQMMRQQQQQGSITGDGEVETLPHQTLLLSLEGHLFDSGLINQVLDVIERVGCAVEFQRVICPSPLAKQSTGMKSSVLLKITSAVNEKDAAQASLNEIETKVHGLVELMEKADASVAKIEPRKPTPSNAAVVEAVHEQHVLVLGSGHVSACAVDYLGRHHQQNPQHNLTITVASDCEDAARKVASTIPDNAGNVNSLHVGLDVANDVHRVSELVADADLVISLLPAPLHTSIVQECVHQTVDFLSASYESQEMKRLGERAEAEGVIILNEVGLDPGLDHMSAMKIIDDITCRGGHVVGFSSICGGLPAPESADNPLHYKFSWNPMGVIRASQNSARYRTDGHVVNVRGDELLQSARPPFATSSDDVPWPDLDLECLPNRDSLHYEMIYGISPKTLFRGTLRYNGFSSLMHVFQNMGLFEATEYHSASWKDLINNELRVRGGFESIDDFVRACAEDDTVESERALQTLDWLGIMGPDASKEPLPTNKGSTVVDAFCGILEDKLSYAAGERDMVVMHHTIDAEFPDDDGRKERHYSALRIYGDTSTASAMSKTVGYTTAASAALILDGSLGADKAGLLLPTEKDIYEPVLKAVEKEGIKFVESSTGVKK